MGMGVIATLYHARFRPGGGARGGDGVPGEEHRGDAGERAAPVPPEHQAADPEEREVDDRAAEEPLDEPGADRDPPGGVGGDGAPAGPARADAPVERAQALERLGWGEVREPDPDDRPRRRLHEAAAPEAAPGVGRKAERELSRKRGEVRRRHRPPLPPPDAL